MRSNKTNMALMVTFVVVQLSTFMAFGGVDKYLYFSNHEANTIERIKMNNSTPAREVILTGRDAMELAADSDAGYIFWMDTYRVWRAELDGANPTQLTTCGWPYSLAVDTVNEELYWSDKQSAQKNSLLWWCRYNCIGRLSRYCHACSNRQC